MVRTSTSARETIDIETSGATVSLELRGQSTVSLHIRGDATAEYQWDVREEGGSWIQNTGTEHTGQSDYDETTTTGVQEIRIRCSSGSGGVDDTADVLVSAGG